MTKLQKDAHHTATALENVLNKIQGDVKDMVSGNQTEIKGLEARLKKCPKWEGKLYFYRACEVGAETLDDPVPGCANWEAKLKHAQAC